MEFLARVNPLYLAAASLFAAKHDFRYYLQGVMIQPHPDGGAVIYATNGHIAGAFYDPEGFAKHQIIMSTPSAPLLRALKLKRYLREFKPRSCWIAERCAVVTYGDWNRDISAPDEEPPELFGEATITTVQSELIDAKYPDITWDRVMPPSKLEHVYDRKAGPMPMFDADVLQPFLDAARLLCPLKYAPLQIIYQGERESAVIRMDGQPNFYGVAMPMIGNQPETLLPGFVEALRSKAKES